MHTFDVYWLWLCLCVALVLLVVEPKQNSNDSAFFCFAYCVQESEIILLWKLPLGGKLQSFLPLLGVVLPGRNCGGGGDYDDDSKQRHPQHSFRRASSCLIFAGLVVVLILLCFQTEFVFIAADRREVSRLVHRIEPKRQGFTLPLGRISLSCFQPNANFPSLFLNLNRFPLFFFDVARILRLFIPFVWLWVSFALVRLCFGGQVNGNPPFGCIGEPGFWMCARDTCSRVLSRGRPKRYLRYTTELPSSSAWCVWWCSFSQFFFFLFRVQRSRFRMAAVWSKFAATFSLFWSAFWLFTFVFCLFVCFDFIFKRESPAVMTFAQVQMVLRFDSNGLLGFWLFPDVLKQGSARFGGFDKLRDHRLRFRGRTHVPRFSKVINFRLCRIGKETFSAKTSRRPHQPVSNVPQNRGGGDLFWIYALDFRRVFAYSAAVLFRTWGGSLPDFVQTSYEWW